MKEIELLKQVDHAHIVKMHGYFIEREANGTECKYYLYIVMEYAVNGDLMQVIEKCKKAKSCVSEAQIWDLTR